jgi:putative FmdB family regulatory protein
MKYEFYCKKCNAIDEVIRTMDKATDPYMCPDCGEETRRNYTVPQVITKGEQIPYFHPAFGKVMTDKQAAEHARSKGLVEVGNENVAKHTPAPRRVAYDEPDYFM